MKRKIAVVLLMLFVISCFLMALTACGNNDNNDDITDVGGSENPDNNGGSENTNNGGNTEQSKCVPIYQGMTITNSNTAISLTSASYRSGEIMLLSANSENNGNNGNHYGHYKGDHADRDDVVDNDNPYPDNSDSENIEEEIKSSLNVVGATNEIYYATQNQDVYINIYIYNPDNFEIMSFTLNGKKYSSYMFEEGSDMETIVLKYNVGAASGIVEYTIDAIKYIDGAEIKDVIIDGDKTVTAGIKTVNQLTASISGINIDTNALSFNANIADKDNLIAFSSGALKAVIYDGAEIVAQKDLAVGENSITFENLKTNTLYQYAIVGYYDDLAGNGFKMNVLYKDVFYTDAVVLFDNIDVGQDSISFGYVWHEVHQNKSISALKLYKDGTFVKDITASSTSVEELLSGTTYTLIAEYPNANTTESIYIEFTTLTKAVPEISLVNSTKTQTSVGFEISETDADNVGAVTKIELIHASGTIVADSLDQRTFASLLSNNAYTVKVTYVYDLNDGEGKHTVTKEIALTTDAKATPEISVVNPTMAQTGVGFEISEIDTDNVGAVTKIELYRGNELVKTADSLTVREFTGLLSNNAYIVKVTYVYDLNDGEGEHTVTKELAITTDAKAVPEISIVNLSNTQTSISFEINKTDVDNVCTITKIELVHPTGTIVADSLDQRIFTNLLSGNEYTIKITCKYDLNNGEGEKISTKEIGVSTVSKSVPTISITATEKTKDSISFGVVENDIDNVGAITKIELVNPRGTIVADSINQRTFSNLLSNNEYTLKITYTYDLNDGKGAQTITQTEQITTDAKSAPSITFDNAVSNSSAISFGINEIDADGIGEIIKIELLLGNDVIRTTTDGNIRTFADLLSNTEYTVRMTYKYNLSNGGEDVTLTKTITIRTSENTIPSILISAGNQTQTSISFAIEESDISGIGSVSKIELLKNGILVKTAENNNVREFTGLLSNAKYTVRVLYEYDLNDGSGKRTETREIKIKTFSKVKPSIIFETTDRTKTSVSFDFNIVDVDNIGYIERIELLKNGDVVSITTNGDDREFVNLLSNTKYTIRVIFAYDLNDGNGVAYIEKTADITTYAKATPEISVSNPSKTQTSVGFSITETDTDNVGAITKIELVHASGAVVADTLDQRAFTNLLSNNAYTVKVTYVYDLNDSEGKHTVTRELAITTLAKATPNFTITNTNKTQTSLGFSIDITDMDSVGAITKVELIHGDDVTTLENVTSHTINDLFSNNNYSIKVTYTYDLNDGLGNRTIVRELTAKTEAKATPEISVVSPTKTQTSVGFEISETDTDNVGAVTKIELVHASGTVVADSLDQRTFANLLSNNVYTVKVTYVYDLNDGAGNKIITKDLTITTLAKATPTVSIITPTKTQTSVGFEISETDADNVGAVTKIELIHASGTIIADSLDQRAFSNLLSNNSYTVRVTYVYDLNDGNGTQTMVVEAIIKTVAKTIPNVTISKTHSESNWIYVDVSRSDSDNTITRIEASILLNGEVVKVQAIDGSCTIEDLLYSTSYTVCITTYYDLNDGNGEQSKTVTVSFATSNYVDEQGISYKTYADGTAEVVGFTKGVTELTIPESVDGYSVTSIANYVFQYSNIVSIVIPSSVQKIGSSAFSGCYSLKKVELNEGLLEIGAYAFEHCEIERFVIPLSVSNVGFCAFNAGGCQTWGYHNAASVNIYIKASTKPSGWDDTVMCIRCQRPFWGFNEFVEQDGMVFALSNNGTAEVVSAIDVKRSIVIPNSVNNCTVIGIAPCAFVLPILETTNITFPDNLCYIDAYAFGMCDLGVLVFPETLSFIGERAFSYAEITSVIINSTTIDIRPYAFNECNSYRDNKDMTVIISLNAVGCINEYAFYDCDRIRFINIPPNMTLNDNAFYGCDNLKFCCLNDRRPSSWGDEWEDGIPVYWSSYVDEQGVVYRRNSNISIDGKPTMTVVDYLNVKKMIADSSSTIIDSSVYIPDKILGRIVYMIGEEAFWDTDIDNIYVAKSVQVVAERAFDEDVHVYYQEGANFYGYGSFIFQDGYFYTFLYGNTRSLNLAKAFCEDYKYELYEDYYDCETGIHYNYYLLEDASISNDIIIPSHIVNYPVTQIGYSAFERCYRITSVTLPDSVTSIGDYAFRDCSSLVSVPIPDTVTYIGDYAFYGCSSLLSITIPNSITSIGYCEFYGCTSLTNVTIGNSVTSIKNYAFYNCTKLTSVTIPQNVKNIGVSAFYGCSNLTSVIIPANVTSIDNWTFYNCTNLTSVIIPDSITSIGYSAFYNCTSLTSIKYLGTSSQWKSISKDSFWDYGTGEYTITYNYTGE